MKTESKVMSVSDLLELKKNSMLAVNPEYQRASVWTESQQKKLIDSVMRCYPLPLFYFHHKVRQAGGMQSEGYEIIDGQQRINALYKFSENALALFDPKKDDKTARFPNFIQNHPCPWAKCTYSSLPEEFKNQFLNTQVSIVKVSTDSEDEARDLFIRLQAGLPLNPQERRDAWPGGFTELILQLGGKQEIVRFPGHEFFKQLVKKNNPDRGQVRQLCAQICMLFFGKAEQGNWIDIGSQAMDDYYYRNLDFDIKSDRVKRLCKILDLAVKLFSGQTSPKLNAYEAIHIVLLLDSLFDDYTPAWQTNFISAYDSFKQNTATARKDRGNEYWTEFGALTQTQSAGAVSIQRRHTFFVKEMYARLKPVLLDPRRSFGAIEREIIYYKHKKLCVVCRALIRWPDLEIHHIEEHQSGGQTTIDNAVPVHGVCHPKEQSAIDFAQQWRAQQQNVDMVEADAERLPRFPVSMLPNGTQCRFSYLSQKYLGLISDGIIRIEGIHEPCASFSAASRAVTNTSRNGWLDWELLLPGSADWISANDWSPAP